MQNTKTAKMSTNSLNSKHVKAQNVTNPKHSSGRLMTRYLQLSTALCWVGRSALPLSASFSFSLLKLPFTKSSLMFLTFWRSGGWTIKILMLAMCAKGHSNTLSNKCSAHTYSGTLSSHCWHPKPCTSGVNQQKLHKHTHKNTNKNRHTHTAKHFSQYPLKKIPLNSWTSDITGVNTLALDLLVHTPQSCNLSCWVITVHRVHTHTQHIHYHEACTATMQVKTMFLQWGM